MKNFVFILLFSLLIGCAHQTTPPLDADGEYTNLTLPCKCGDVSIYIPQSCACFDKEQSPEIASALEKVYAWTQSHKNGSGKKLIGKYIVLKLTCGCLLKVYIPDSSGCLEIQSPDLANLLKVVYDTAKKHELVE